MEINHIYCNKTALGLRFINKTSQIQPVESINLTKLAGNRTLRQEMIQINRKE